MMLRAPARQAVFRYRKGQFVRLGMPLEEQPRRERRLLPLKLPALPRKLWPCRGSPFG